MLAPVVALVPTPFEANNCAGATQENTSNSPGIANNLTALLALGAIALIITIALAIAGRESKQIWYGIAGAVGLWALTVAVFVTDRKLFEDKAHYTAAIVMFLAIVVVVSLNALAVGQEELVTDERAGPRAYANRYAVVAVSMVVSVLVVLTWKWTAGFEHAVLAIEAALIALFAVFWLLQTKELWSRGLRQEAPP